VKKLLNKNLQNILRTTYNLFNNWRKNAASTQKTFLFLMRSCSIHILVLHSFRQRSHAKIDIMLFAV